MKYTAPRSRFGFAHVIALVVLGVAAFGALYITSHLQKSQEALRTNAAAVEVTVEYPLSSKNAIANADGSMKSVGQTKAWMGTGQNVSASYLAMNFTGEKVPANATLKSAQLTITAVGGWITTNFSIFGNTSNASDFSATTLSALPVTTATKSVSENVKWEANREYSFDVTDPVRELFGAGDKNSFTLVAKGSGPQYGRKELYGEPATGKSPKLRLVYEIRSTTTQTTTPTATATVVPSLPSGTPIKESGHVMVGENAHALGLWNPNPKYDTCPNASDTTRIKEIHDSYKVQGPDGKWYPTWHPPVDPATGCKFGHEHGRDPKGSTEFRAIQETYGYDADGNGKVEGAELATAGVPFGYVNEQLDVFNTARGITNGMRHEDHVGHKIEWENNLQRDWSTVNGGSARVPSGIYCNFFMKVHQGTHSKDAFTNNMHELIQAYSCTDGIKLVNANMVVFGKPGEFSVGGVAQGFVPVVVGAATPANSPTGTGLRSISTIDRVKEFVLKPAGQWSLYSEGVYEDWISASYIKKSDGTVLSYYDPHFAVFGPSRFYWKGTDTNTYGITRTAQDKLDNVGRSIDVCFMSENGNERFQGGACDELTNYRKITNQISYDDPRSPFNGVKREFYFNNMTVENVGDTRVWFADPFGGNAQTTPFTGSVKHYLKPANPNVAHPYPFESNAIGGERSYGGPNIHAPN